LATWRGPDAPDDGRPGGWRSRWRAARSRSGGRHPGRGPRWLGLVRGTALVLAPLLIVAMILPVDSAGTARASACGKAVGPFTVHGTKVLAGDGSEFITYGLAVSGLQDDHWTQGVLLDLAKIRATAEDWCANTVRLQLNQDMLLGPNGTGFNTGYMEAIRSEVSLAESYKLVVVLNDETNFSPPAIEQKRAGPTPGTEVFWKDMAAVYGHDPQVIFDLYNEPRTSDPTMPDATLWKLWLDGGTFRGVYYPFGMAHLAEYVRNTVGARNLFWIEGPRYSLSFAGMLRYHAQIHVSGVVYAIHHDPGAHDVQAWNANFGYLVADGIAPVVEGEFTNYEPPPNPDSDVVPGYCWTNAPTAVPQYFDYLVKMGIGMNAFQLDPGWLIRSNKHLDQPTSINPKTWSCVPSHEPEPHQSAGALIKAWFEQRNG